MDIRVGHGYDVHRFSSTPKPLILCGLQIHDSMGLEAHSDGDVVLHAVCDALLGAAALRDIGYHFPDTDSTNKNRDSCFFIQSILAMLKHKGYIISNIDITIMAQQPKLMSHIPNMASSLAKLLFIDNNRVNIKATTTEKLGFIGRKEGIATEAVVLIYQPEASK